MRILLVEDEDGIASFVSKGLSAEGHTVDRAATVKDAKTHVSIAEYDVVLLDLGLPDGDGTTVLAHIRSAQSETPVIVLSARDSVDDKVELLDQGADDYLAKPFAFAELAARVRAATRAGRERSDVLEAAGVRLDIRTRTVETPHGSFELSGREYALLEYLMLHAGRVLTRQQLLDAVWGFGFDTVSNVVDVYVGYLRKRLDQPDQPSVIETVRGAGYRFRA